MKSIFTFVLIFVGTGFCFSQTNSQKLEIVSMDEATKSIQSDKIVIEEINSEHLNRESLLNPKNSTIYDPNDIYQKELEIINSTKNISTTNPN
ncbi:MAG: hypothetical protein AB7O47_03215 [Flavobacteriales bacterium]